MYMYPPVVTTAERGNLVGMEQGALVYNTRLNRLQVLQWVCMEEGNLHRNLKTYTYLCMDCKSDYIFFKRQ